MQQDRVATWWFSAPVALMTLWILLSALQGLAGVRSAGAERTAANVLTSQHAMAELVEHVDIPSALESSLQSERSASQLRLIDTLCIFLGFLLLTRRVVLRRASPPREPVQPAKSTLDQLHTLSLQL